MPTQLNQNKLISPIIASLILHLVSLKLLEFIPKDFFASSKSSLIDKNKTIKVSSISREDLKKYRTVGIKNGKKNFSTPIKTKKVTEHQTKKKPVIKVKSKVKSKRKRTETKKKQISLNSLRVKTKRIEATKMIRPLQPLSKTPSKSNLEITTNKETSRQNRRELQTDVLKQLANSPDNATILRKTGFNMQLEPPEGVSQDELNSMEKIFYSFQKRTFQNYVGSFLKTYRQLLINRPSVKPTIENDLHRLTARVIFDKEGHIVSIKILRSSHSDDIHNLFEKTLKDIRKLPNPPKDLLSKKGQFTIYYQLNIN
jgi:multidrug efflux pump subunit AcrB